jgi:pimeloyl-ACP methyl ester carboxylesterase
VPAGGRSAPPSDQPTLVLAGDDDPSCRWSRTDPWLCRFAAADPCARRRRPPIVPLINGRILAHLIPDATLYVVPGGGHLLPSKTQPQ